LDLTQKHKTTQRPINATDVPDGKLLVQFVFNHGGNLLVWNGIGDAREFALADATRRKFVWAVLAAVVSMICAVYDLRPAMIEQDPALETDLLAPDGTRAYRTPTN
jgi:hypothetical protein